MTVTEGTYVILSAKDTDFALDVQGGLDDTGRLVQLWTRNGSDAQLVRLLKRGEGTNTWRVLFVMSGKSLDRDNNGYANGTKVQQWDSLTMDHPSQMWEILEDGKTVNVTSFDEHYTLNSVILKHPDHESCLDIEGQIMADGTKVQMYDRNGTDAQRWVLLPKESVVNGTYVIRSAMDPNMVIDVANAGTADGTNVQIYAENGNSNQSWQVINYKEGTCRFISLCNNKSMDVASGVNNVEGANIQVWATNDDESDPNRANQLFVPVQYDSIWYNGNEWPLYTIRVYAGTNKVVDATGGKAELATNVQAWTENWTRAQRWLFTPVQGVSPELPVPSSGGFITALAPDAVPMTDVQVIPETITVYPAWICEGESFQLRYKMQGRLIDADANESMDEETDWMSIRDGSTANEGWGNTGEANCPIVHLGPGTYTASSKGIPLSFVDKYDYYKFTFEVRRYERNFSSTGLPETGNAGTFSVTVSRKATITLDETAYMTPLGLRISYTTSWSRNGNSLSIESDDFGKYDFGNVAANGSVTVPIEILPRVYEEGETLTVNATFTNSDGAISTTSKTIKIGPSEGSIAVTATVSIEDTIATVRTQHENAKVWLVVHRPHGDKLVLCDTLVSSDGGYYSYRVVPPIGVEWEVSVMVDDGSEFGYKTVSGSIIQEDIPSHHICYLDGSNDIPLRYSTSSPGPSFKPSYTRDSSTSTTTGRERNIVTFGNTVQSTWTMSANLVLIDRETAFEQADKLAHMAYGIYRSYQGYWAQVAVKSVEIDYANYESMPISINLEEVDL